MATPLPDNTVALSLPEIAAATSGEVVHVGADRVEGIATDTRADLRGKAFVALRGERFDAHDFLTDALQAGASCLIVDREVSFRPNGASVVRVASTLEALGALARHHRRRWGGKVIAVAGSAGKTTTRSAIEAALTALRPERVHATTGNLNNRIGLPLTLLAVHPQHEVCVLEVGTNQLGEVPALAAVCEPDVAVLTLVDLEHSEGLGDLDSIEQEEGALLQALSATGCAVGNGDDERVRRCVRQSPAGTRLLYGTSSEADYRIIARHPVGHTGSRLEGTRPGDATIVEFECPLVGEPGALAAGAAWAVAEHVAGRGLDGQTLTSALADLKLAGRLSRVVLGDGCLVLDDSYNSNPASVRKSIETAAELARLREGRLWLVLGEMRELGAATRVEHEKMGRVAAQSGASGLFVIGSLAEPAVVAASDGGLGATFCADAEEALAPLLDRLRPKDVVLVKASRGVKAERVVESLIQARGQSR